MDKRVDIYLESLMNIRDLKNKKSSLIPIEENKEKKVTDIMMRIIKDLHFIKQINNAFL